MDEESEKIMGLGITRDCILCGMCADVCEVDAIIGVDDPNLMDQFRYEIEADRCVECGNCREVCPAGAIQEWVGECVVRS